MDTRTGAISSGRRWLMFASAFAVALFAGFNMFKAPPLFTTLISTLGFSSSNIGWVTSMFSLISVVLAFPAGGILARIGVRKCLLIAAGGVVVGSALGALAISWQMLLATRFIEGIGLGLISVVGPAAVASLFPRGQSGLAMGIWTIWFPFAIVIGLNASPAIFAIAGWRAVWWIGAALSLASLLFVWAVYREPEKNATVEQEQSPAHASEPNTARKAGFVGVILATVAFGCWNIFFGGAIASFYPTFLQQVHGMSVQFAGTAASITNILVLVLGPVSGVISDRLGTRKGLMVFAMIGAIVMLFIAFSGNTTLVWVYLVVMALFAAAMPTGTFAIVPELAGDPSRIGLGMATLAFFQNLGIAIGSAAFGPIAADLGWNTASLAFLVPVAVVGLVITFFVKGRKRA
jgi:predicted MFS family arabinose efflux permease